MTVASISALLGGREALKRKVVTDLDLHFITRQGLPAESLILLAKELAVGRKAMAKAIGISERTFVRRTAKNEQLSARESNRVVRLAQVFAKAVDTLGASEKASRWLQKPNLALQGEVPLDLLDTYMGARAVERILLRIDCGTYS